MRQSYRSARGSGEGDASSWMPAVAVAGVLVILVGLGWHIWQYSRAQKMTLPLKVGVAFDLSGGTDEEAKYSGSMDEGEKRLSIKVLFTLIDEVFPSRTPMRIWFYSELLHEKIDVEPSGSVELDSFAKRIIKERLGKWRTYQGLPMQAMIDYANRNPNRKIGLCLFTDGEDHTPKETARLATEMARLPNVCAVLVGPLEEQFRMGFRQRLQPLEDAGKLIVFGMGDTARAVEELRRLLTRLDKEEKDGQSQS